MDQTVTLTQNQAIGLGLGLGGIIGGVLTVTLIFALAFAVLLIIGWWKLFTKAGEPGWKSIIPIYNVYTFCRIIGINFWIFVLAIPAALSILLAITAGSAVTTLNSSSPDFASLPTMGLISYLIVCGYAIFFDIYTAIKLGDAFKKGTGFKVGLALLPNIFLLILAFGKSSYNKPAVAKK